MNKTLKSIQFELFYLLRSSLIFLAIFAATYLVMLLAFIPASFSGNAVDRESTFSFIFCAMIYVFIATAETQKGFFNELLMFSNTRRSIITASFTSSVIFCAAMSVFSILFDGLNNVVTKYCGYTNVNFLSWIYSGDHPNPAGNLNPLLILLWYFTFLLMLAFLAQILGAFIYRFGRTARIAFWIGYGVLFFVFSTLSAIPVFGQVMKELIYSFFEVGKQNLMPLASLHFLIAAVIFGVIAYLMNRRQTQAA